MAKLEEVGVEAVVKGFGLFLVQMGAMNKAIAATGANSIAATVGVAAFSLAVGGIAVASVAVVAALAAVAAGFIAIGVASVNVARSVEDAFAGVAKTTDGLTDEFGAITDAGIRVLDQFRELARDIPLALEELLRIGELGGQLGVPEEALQGFTRAIAALVVSTDLGAEQAALSLARIQNIYDIEASAMVETTERLASAIVFLGNNFAATEPEITDFSERIAGAGKIVGLTLGEIAGISTAFVSVGVEAQAGGTAVQTVLQEMAKAVALGGKELDKFAETAGVTVDEFVTLFGEDAAGAFGEFVIGLGESGTDAFAILEELGIADRRIIRGFLSVAGAGDLLSDAILAGNEAFEDNTALTREATIRYATFNSQLEIAKNRIRDVALEIGGPLADGLKDILIDEVFPLIDALSGPFVDAFNEVRDSVVDNLLPALADLLDAFGIDLSEENLIKGIQTFGEKTASGIEAISNILGIVSELIRIVREEGFKSLLNELGIQDDTIEKVGEVVSVLFTLGVNLFLVSLAMQAVSILNGLWLALGAAATPVGVLALAIAGLLTVIDLLGPNVKKTLDGIEINFGRIAVFLTAEIGFLFINLATAFRQFVIDWITQALLWWLGTISVIQEKVDLVIEIIATLIRNTIAILTGNKSALAAAAGTMMGGLIDGVTGGFNSAISVAKGKSKELAKVVSNALALSRQLASINANNTRLAAQVAPSSSGDRTVSTSRTFAPTINATYQNVQSPSTIARDLSLLGKLA